MKDLLMRLVEGEYPKREEIKQVMLGITEERYPAEQIAALLMALQIKGITPDVLLGFRDGLLQTGVPVDLGTRDVIDIVGTGGDRKNTFNISTCACFVVAGAGYKVAKHGNYAATSVSGASSVLENHGVKFQKDEGRLRQSLEECNFTYLHAPFFAYGMKFVGPIRKALSIPTCFNLLGPLVNPCRPAYQLLGVATLGQVRLYHNTLSQIDVKYGIVNSIDGYDEISGTSDFKFQTRERELVRAPEDLGFARIKPEEIYGGSTALQAMSIFDDVLNNRGTDSQKNVVVINAAYAIKLMEPEHDINECLAIARESVESGRALAAFKKYVEICNI
ncbi:MAG: anthranilate phosphoribosyltransferase [Bacteroidales bacterium]|nr:anthranilate phosphoribosyltransferase [Bacteroidales bacterium]